MILVHIHPFKHVQTTQTLQQREEKRLHEIQQVDPCQFNPDAEIDLENHLLQRWIREEDNPNEAILIRTGEIMESFWSLYNECKASLTSKRKSKRPAISSIDSLLLILAYYKHYQRIYELAIESRAKITTLHDTISRTASKIAPVLKSKWLQMPSATELAAEIPPQSPFPTALLIVDSVFLPSQAPMVTFPAAREYYSKKHENYGVKYQIMHARGGRAVAVSRPFLGSILILRSTKKNYLKLSCSIQRSKSLSLGTKAIRVLMDSKAFLKLHQQTNHKTMQITIKPTPIIQSTPTQTLPRNGRETATALPPRACMIWYLTP